MSTTVLGIFDDPATARRALEELQDSELHIDDISIISRATESGAPVSDDSHITAGGGVAVGALWGGAVGLAALLIPGVGPLVAGGALIAALTGAAAGALVGGVAGALIDHLGISAEEATQYAHLVQIGKTLVAAKVRSEDATEVRRILAKDGATEIHDGQSDADGRALDNRVRVATYDATGAPIPAETRNDYHEARGPDGSLLGNLGTYEATRTQDNRTTSQPNPVTSTPSGATPREQRDAG